MCVLRRVLLFSFCLFVSLIGVCADGKESPPTPRPFPTLQINLPLLDIPFNRSDDYNSRFVTSMRQSVELSKSFYQITYPTLVRALSLHESKPGSPDRFGKLALFATYLIGSSYLPLGDAWVHEEYHRAVLKNRGINSHNEVYDLKVGGESISVSRIKDEDLALLKKKHPYDLIRTYAAGYEGDNQLVSSLQKDAFFLGTSRADWIVWLNVLNEHLYIRASASGIEEQNFTGFDFTEWVYDLHRPREDYTARSGVDLTSFGIDRYVKLSDLTSEEIRYLKKQRDLSLFNVAGLFLMEPHKVRLFSSGEEFLLIARPMHYLTSFGYTLNADFLLKSSDLNLSFSLQNQFNDDHYFPGVDMEIINYPCRILGKDVAVTPRFSVWLQPEGQNFRTSKSEQGGLVSVKTSTPLKNGWSTYLELEGKTKGWVAGNVYLDDNVSARTGFTRLW
jgi:hypothetical protein